MRPSSLKKRQKYLAVATELFLEQGYEATGLDQLIKRCGGSKLTLYNYFGDKKGLLKAVVNDVTEQLRQTLNFETQHGDSVHDQLFYFSLNYLRFLYSPDLLKLTRLVMAHSRENPELVTFFLERGAFHSQATLRSYIEEQAEAGQLKVDDAYSACEQLLGALKGNRHFEAMFTDYRMSDKEMKEYTANTVDAFLRSYQ